MAETLAAASQQTNLLSIDVEEWFHTSALDRYIGIDQWESLASRLAPNVYRLLEILETRKIKATFFILGWVAERHPNLVREIADRGHEIASHGYRHRLIYDLTPEKFKDYLARAKKGLEDIIGKRVAGYRATSFSIVKKSLWALELIREAGFLYDSSIVPIGYHDLYGIEGFPRFPFVHGNGVMEIPPSTIRILGKNIPLGGGYFRLLPYWLTRQGINRINREGQPAMIYLHPWELDACCPRVEKADLRTRFRQYVNLHRTEARLTKLLEDFRWGAIIDYINANKPVLRSQKN
jgi:polysaccharide deacetylase family protein (PEP-CTERM system associated)